MPTGRDCWLFILKYILIELLCKDRNPWFLCRSKTSRSSSHDVASSYILNHTPRTGLQKLQSNGDERRENRNGVKKNMWKDPNSQFSWLLQISLFKKTKTKKNLSLSWLSSFSFLPCLTSYLFRIFSWFREWVQCPVLCGHLPSGSPSPFLCPAFSTIPKDTEKTLKAESGKAQEQNSVVHTFNVVILLLLTFYASVLSTPSCCLSLYMDVKSSLGKWVRKNACVEPGRESENSTER